MRPYTNLQAHFLEQEIGRTLQAAADASLGNPGRAHVDGMFATWQRALDNGCTVA